MELIADSWMLVHLGGALIPLERKMLALRWRPQVGTTMRKKRMPVQDPARYDGPGWMVSKRNTASTGTRSRSAGRWAAVVGPGG